MPRLIILGNGFDRNYKLPTDYRKHLRPILEKINPNLFEKIDKLYFNEKIEYWSDFEAKIGDVENIDFLHNGLEEAIDPLYQEDIDYYPVDSEHYGDDYSAIENAKFAAEGNRIDLEQWFEENHKDNFEEFNSFIETGFRYMAQDANKLLRAQSQSLSKDFRFSKDDYYIVFNYTSTLEILYPEIPTDHICHIHGWVEDEDELIYGNTEDNLYSGDSEFITENPNYSLDDEGNPYYSNYKEFLETVVYSEEEQDRYNKFVVDTISELNDSMIKPLQEERMIEFLDGCKIEEVLLYGLSIGRVDIPYLEKINEMFPQARWFISYYRDKTDPVVSNALALTFSQKIKFEESNEFKTL